MTRPYNLGRFTEAQDPVYMTAHTELRQGRKTGHWMWFIFPQIAGLGHSPAARKYAIASLHEARAYLEHPVLGNRLRECTEAVTQVEGVNIQQILGHPDDLKFRSCMTLFAHATLDNQTFLTKSFCQPPHEPALYQGTYDTHAGKQITILFRSPAKRATRPHGKGAFQAGKYKRS